MYHTLIWPDHTWIWYRLKLDISNSNIYLPKLIKRFWRGKSFNVIVWTQIYQNFLIHAVCSRGGSIDELFVLQPRAHGYKGPPTILQNPIIVSEYRFLAMTISWLIRQDPKILAQDQTHGQTHGPPLVWSPLWIPLHSYSNVHSL